MASKSTDTFWPLLSHLRNLLAETWGSDGRYRWLFRDHPRFTKRLYSYFGISGAAIAVANPILKRFVLLQNHSRDLTPDLTIELPFSPQKKTAGKHLVPPLVVSSAQFSATIHELFILHRQGQALELCRHRFSWTRDRATQTS